MADPALYRLVQYVLVSNKMGQEILATGMSDHTLSISNISGLPLCCSFSSSESKPKKRADCQTERKKRVGGLVQKKPCMMLGPRTQSSPTSLGGRDFPVATSTTLASMSGAREPHEPKWELSSFTTATETSPEVSVKPYP
jgi:hypothetical protein